jgi:hypothetical protein
MKIFEQGTEATEKDSVLSVFSCSNLLSVSARNWAILTDCSPKGLVMVPFLSSSTFLALTQGRLACKGVDCQGQNAGKRGFLECPNH